MGRGVRVADAVRFALGMIAVAVALLSPIDALADRSFAPHMIEHELLMVVAAPAVRARTAARGERLGIAARRAAGRRVFRACTCAHPILGDVDRPCRRDARACDRAVGMARTGAVRRGGAEPSAPRAAAHLLLRVGARVLAGGRWWSDATAGAALARVTVRDGAADERARRAAHVRAIALVRRSVADAGIGPVAARGSATRRARHVGARRACLHRRRAVDRREMARTSVAGAFLARSQQRRSRALEPAHDRDRTAGIAPRHCIVGIRC